MIRYLHTNIVARDVKVLADFYQKVFGCEISYPESTLTGDALARGTGVPDVEIRGIWLQMPGGGENGPILELFQYNNIQERPAPAPNQLGYAHLSFEVDDIEAVADAVLAAGGSYYGQIADFKSLEGGTLTFVYLSDPEGNIVELEQAAI